MYLGRYLVAYLVLHKINSKHHSLNLGTIERLVEYLSNLRSSLSKANQPKYNKVLEQIIVTAKP